MQFKNVLLVIICAIALTLPMVACTHGDTETEKVVSDSKSISDRKILQLYVWEHDDLIKNSVNLYNSKYSDVPIEMTLYTASEMEELKAKLSVSLSAGNGPDFLHNYGLDDFLPPYYSLIKNGVLCNLDDIIKKDSEFNLKEYNEKILNCGIYQGKRYLIPLNYVLPAFWTTEDAMQKNLVNMEKSQWTWKDAGNVVSDYMNRNGSSEKYFFTYNFGFSNILRSCRPDLIDYSKKKSYFNTPEFIELLKAFKDINPSIFSYGEMMKYEGMVAGLLKDNKIIMVDGVSTLNFGGLSYYNSISVSLLNSRMKLFPYPSYSAGESVSAIPSDLIGITSTCKYKDEAFRLIKIALSKDVLSSMGAYMPLDKRIFKEYIAKYSAPDQAGRELGGAGGIDKYLTVPLSTSLVKEYESLVNSLGDSYLIDYEVINMIEDELKQYLNNKESAEQAAKAMDEKVTLFLNE